MFHNPVLPILSRYTNIFLENYARFLGQKKFSTWFPSFQEM